MTTCTWGQLGMYSERDLYIWERAELAWKRFGPAPAGVSAPLRVLVEVGPAEKRGHDTDGTSSEASSGERGLAATTLVVISAAAAEEAARSSTQKTGGRRKQQRAQPSAEGGRQYPPGHFGGDGRGGRHGHGRYEAPSGGIGQARKAERVLRGGIWVVSEG